MEKTDITYLAAHALPASDSLTAFQLSHILYAFGAVGGDVGTAAPGGATAGPILWGEGCVSVCFLAYGEKGGW